MITAITVENFKGVKRRGFVFNRVSAVVDGDGVDIFLVIDALGSKVVSLREGTL